MASLMLSIGRFSSWFQVSIHSASGFSSRSRRALAAFNHRPRPLSRCAGSTPVLPWKQRSGRAGSSKNNSVNPA